MLDLKQRLDTWDRSSHCPPELANGLNRIVEWLNGLPDTQRVLATDFNGREINEQNLTEWKQGGHQDWPARQETLACARELAADAG